MRAVSVLAVRAPWKRNYSPLVCTWWTPQPHEQPVLAPLLFTVMAVEKNSGRLDMCQKFRETVRCVRHFCRTLAAAVVLLMLLLQPTTDLTADRRRAERTRWFMMRMTVG